jgi:transcriptional regulator GlxA family with amidase domain
VPGIRGSAGWQHRKIEPGKNMNQFAISKQQIENSPLRSIGIIIYPGVEVIDIVGPTEVFMFANKALQMEGLTTKPVYKCELLAKDDQPVTTMSGVQVVPTNSYRKFVGTFDTLIVPGGENSQEAMKDANLIECICIYSKNVRRLASVCTGAFLLAKSGVLDGRRATTHWYFSSSFKDAFPLVRLEPDKIFVHDGSIWSSGGVTSGIDLALAMVEEDWGHQLALFIARFLVIFMKRSGGQSQFSPYLETAAADRIDFRDLQVWIMENPSVDLRVKALAQRVEMSPRNFARVFLLETGVTPAKYVERVRTDLVRHYLENTDKNVSEIAQKTGFKDTETMRRTFIRHIGVNPVDYRDRFGRKHKHQPPSKVESG